MVMGVMAIGRIPITVIGPIIPTVIGLTTMAAEVVIIGAGMTDTTGKAEAEAAAIIGTAVQEVVGDMAADRAENTAAPAHGEAVQVTLADGIRAGEEVSRAAINGEAAALVVAAAFAPVRGDRSEAAVIILAVGAAVRAGVKT